MGDAASIAASVTSRIGAPVTVTHDRYGWTFEIDNDGPMMITLDDADLDDRAADRLVRGFCLAIATNALDAAQSVGPAALDACVPVVGALLGMSAADVRANLLDD